jgi:hypothetical protein
MVSRRSASPGPELQGEKALTRALLVLRHDVLIVLGTARPQRRLWKTGLPTLFTAHVLPAFELVLVGLKRLLRFGFQVSLSRHYRTPSEYRANAATQPGFEEADPSAMLSFFANELRECAKDRHSD